MKASHIIKFLLYLLLLISYNTFGQVVFEEGYFIDNNDIKTACLIKNYEWKNSPTKIEYRLTEFSEPITANISEVKEFRISNIKYQRFTLLIDHSSNAIANLSNDKEPIFIKDTVFLRLIIEGYANLYEAAEYKRYFYSVNKSEVAQLVHKEYLVDTRVATNSSYKSQLWEDLKCSCINIEDIENVAYNKKDLVNIFEKYNICLNSDFINYDIKQKKVAFDLVIRPGLKGASLSIKNQLNNSQNIDFGSSLSFSFGIAAELVLPINKNKWAVTFEPTYQYYKAEDPRPNFNNTVNYKSIELPIGLKYNFFLSEKSKIFLTASVVVLDIPFNSSIGSLEINSTNNLNFGFGYCFNNKFSAEIRYGSRRRLLSKYTLYTSDYQSLSFVLGYNIF